MGTVNVNEIRGLRGNQHKKRTIGLQCCMKSVTKYMYTIVLLRKILS